MSESRLSLSEYVAIDASMRCMLYSNLDHTEVHKRKEEAWERTGRSRDSEDYQRYKHAYETVCDEQPPTYKHIRYKRCPHHFATDISHLLTMYDLYDKGSLPYPGALVNQPAKVIEALQLIRSIINEKQAADEREREAEQKKAAAKSKHRSR